MSVCVWHRGLFNKIPVPPLSLSHGQPLADDVPMAQSCNKLPTASTSALLGWLGAKLVHSSPCLSRSVAHGARAPQPAWREKVGFIENTALRHRRVMDPPTPSPDDVYYYIRWRLKLEGETENMRVCTKERKGVTAAVLMATPCTNSLGGESGGQRHEGLRTGINTEVSRYILVLATRSS